MFAALLILVPCIVLVALADRSARDSLTAVIGRQLAREAVHTAERLSTLLQSEQRTLQSFARQDLMREIRVGDIDKRVSQALTTLRQGNGNRLGYLVVEPGGKVVAASSASWMGLGGAFSEWVARLALEPVQRVVFEGPIEAGGQRALAIATPIPDPDGSGATLGLLVGFLDWNAVTALLDEVRADLGLQGIRPTLMVVDASSVPLAASGDDASHATGPEEPGEQPGYRVELESSSIIGRALLDADAPPWRVLVIEPLHHALEPARALTQRLALLTGLALAVALAIAALSAQRVVRPLSALTRAIRGIAGGNLAGVEVPVRSDDEVGELARAFNQMAGDLARTQRDLIDAEKFAFVGELASGVAHEVRTSLGVLRSAAQLLGRSLASAPGTEIPELVGMIRDEVGRLGGVVDDLLKLDHPRGMQREPTPLSLPLERASEFVEPQAREKGVEILFVRAGSDPRVSCDREALQHVCVNLLVNAVQSLSRGGRVELVIEDACAGFGCFRVSDDGPGVPEELRKRIFEPFMTGRETGVGLGLTFVARAVHEHGGRISVERSDAGGASFRVEIPLVEEPA